MRAFIFLIVLVIGAASIPASPFAQTMDPMEILRSVNQFHRTQNNNSTTLKAMRDLQVRGALANQRARQERELQNQGLEKQLEIEREKTRQLELQLRLRRQ